MQHAECRRRTRSADSTEKNGVVLPELVQTALGDVAARLLVRAAAPVEVVEVEVEGAIELGQCLQHAYTCIDDFGADAVGAHCRDGVRMQHSRRGHVCW